MIAMYLRTFIIKILFFIFIRPPFFFKIRGRHSTTDVSYMWLYHLYIIKTIEQTKFYINLSYLQFKL